jgi:superfamily II DNA or RNA helicase
MSYQLRPPQIVVRDKIKTAISQGSKKILVFAPTSFGKTILSFDIIRSALAKGNGVLFTSHRIVLAEQSAKKFESLNPNYLQGNSTDFKEESLLTVATIQTLINTEIRPPKIIIVDEVHYAYESNLIQSLFDKFPDAIFIGLSATPVDDRGFLLEGFDSIIDDFQTKDLMELGWLTPFKVFCPMSVNVSKVKQNDSDYDEKSLSEVINKDDINDSIVDNYIKICENRKFICFAVNKKHCSDLKDAFGRKGIQTEIITADTSPAKRLKILKAYADGELKGLISIEILTAGFDDPTVMCVVLATITKSWRKYVQECGRGIRLLGQSLEESIANGKPDCILMDCVGNIEEHGLPDDRKTLLFKKKISKVIDRQLGLDLDNEKRNEIKLVLSEEKQIYLKRIGSLLDIYDGKVYKLESDLQEDVNSFLKKTGYFWWRQNSGKAFIKGQWVHFASKNGLPDNSVFFSKSSLFFGVELKLPHGRLTDHQKITLPEMTQQRVLAFIAESILDVYHIIEHVEKNTRIDASGTFISNEIYQLPQRQIELRNRLNIPLYGT